MAALETIEQQTGPNPGATIIVLHGLGADGNDFVPIAQEIDLASIGDVRYVFPHAPVIPVTINNGYEMRAWYDILGMELVRREDEAGLRRSRLQVEALIEREVERGIAANRIVLMGFSQGCAMALMTGLRYKERLAGIVGLSGYLPLAGTTVAERTDANVMTPIFMGHGTQDNVVPAERGRASRDMLKGLGYDVQWHEYPMAHSVCMEEIQDLNAWLVRTLAKT
ncbi:carboxylesterase [Caenimonas koreensis DSM 17982]|uniref:Carboxylesterase n=1 Tax=Caenimonas koreensis DSM 17982 TaxID=1121255 RepID=A0A844AZE4_9BURK|nr:alpha/beta hydrolase [Caenimonas koreensis]MRD49715.1 carboxylesterase [Caenimonas koreensis DSM 17982]